MSVLGVNGIDIYYDTTGDPGGRAVLLVAGLGMQCTSWPPSWTAHFAADGRFVVAFDNRDVGLSTHLASAGSPDLLGFLQGRGIDAPYLLAAMADDAAGLLDRLEIDQAHVIGVSMGGMIVQELAIRHPSRLVSLCSIMSTTGDPSVGAPSPEALATLMNDPPSSADEAAELAVSMSNVIGSPAYPADPVLERARAIAAYERSNDPAGVARQLAAILASPDRTARLGGVTVPTLVIHGASDPLIGPSGGEATARAIGGAELVMVEGMGHDLPPELDDRLLGAIDANLALGEATGAAHR